MRRVFLLSSMLLTLNISSIVIPVPTAWGRVTEGPQTNSPDTTPKPKECENTNEPLWNGDGPGNWICSRD